jgi:regulator of ribonuclease activity A
LSAFYNFCLDQSNQRHILMTSILATCDLCDAHKNDLPEQFRVLPPAFRDFGARLAFAGPVTTVKCYEDNTLVKAAVESSGVEDGISKVLVVDGAGSLRRALLGGNLGAAAAKNGWAGLVIDGCVRDVAELAVLDVGIRALGAVPMPTDRKAQGQKDVPVQIQGVWVHPGDWLYADADGVVISATRLS